MIARWIVMASLGQTGLSPADLPAYRDALLRPSDSARTATFRDLWDRPDAHRGRPVRVTGRVVRRFRAVASGELPARSEWWLAAESGDLLCVVFPETLRASSVDPDEFVTFVGTSLGTIRYAAGDVTRLAPLIVGSGPPIRVASPATAPAPVLGWGPAGFAAGAGVAVVAFVLIAAHHSRRPPPARPRADESVEFES